ncbi:Acetyl esterase/lipase [Devosia enhydra]|uniref:Acetyl esterase/lipase n=1 Tax=Devosia enhydra TaxID=665118 RepID=A0A1K2HYL4_9HYPH|nr:alpha/beta hydrolase [Devosia enhydra]SFZ85011.1 Acetyl esterase/lipase [Devosia enhydra]
MSAADPKSFIATASFSVAPPKPVEPPRLDADMGHVLAVWQKLGGRGLQGLKLEEARALPPLVLAARTILRRTDDMGVDMEPARIPGAAGLLDARVYRRRAAARSGEAGAILFFPGGGWVLGSLDAHDETCRTLALRTGAVVIAVLPRQAPEHKFPAAHDDANALWAWLMREAEGLRIDPRRCAVAGEGSGGNLAFNVALFARDSRGADKLPHPVHVAMLTPVAGGGLDTPSHRECGAALPLGTPGAKWLGQQVFEQTKQAYDKRIALALRADLSGLPPISLVLAGADPLRSDGEQLGQALKRSGIRVTTSLYDGVTHDFFGLGQVVTKAAFAQGEVGMALALALGTDPRYI